MKKIALLLAAALTAVSLAGCGGTVAAPAPAASAPAAEAPAAEAPAAEAPAAEGPVEFPVDYNYNLSIYSGSTSGSWYAATAAIANFLEKDINGLTATVTPGAGPTNVLAIQTGEADFAFGKYPSTVDGYNGVGAFADTGACDKVRYMFYLYDEAFHMIVRADSGINSVEDLKGKVLTAQTTGNLAEQMTRDLLSLYGMTYDDLSRVNQCGYEDSVQQMKDGTADVFTFATAFPAAVYADLASSGDYKVISFDADTLAKMAEINAGYLPITIPAGTYKGQDEDVTTFGAAIHMMCSADLDEELQYYITKSIIENLPDIQATHSTYANISLDKMYVPDTYVPLAAGTERYLKEVGYIK